MNLRLIVTVLLFLLSEALGLACGEWFFRLHVAAIPPVGQSTFNANASHVAHLLYGVGVGLVMFLWAQLAMVIEKGFAAARARKSAATPAAPAPPAA